jgi:hypothetical protein
MEEAVAMYDARRGLVIWATSSNGVINSAKLYGCVRLPVFCETHIVEPTLSWDRTKREIIKTPQLQRALHALSAVGASYGGYGNINEGLDIDIDLREGAVSKISLLEEHFLFCPIWTTSNYLWFVDYAEEHVKGYDPAAITLGRFNNFPKALQDIIRICFEPKVEPFWVRPLYDFDKVYTTETYRVVHKATGYYGETIYHLDNPNCIRDKAPADRFEIVDAPTDKESEV